MKLVVLLVGTAAAFRAPSTARRARAAPRAPRVSMGLAWDVTDGKNIDLDASVITLTEGLEQVEIVYFGKLKSQTGSIVHQGRILRL